MLNYSIHTSMPPSDVLSLLRSQFTIEHERTEDPGGEEEFTRLMIPHGEPDGGNVYVSVSSEATNPRSPYSYTLVHFSAMGDDLARRVVELVRDRGFPLASFDDGYLDDVVYAWDLDADSPLNPVPDRRAS